MVKFSIKNGQVTPPVFKNHSGLIFALIFITGGSIALGFGIYQTYSADFTLETDLIYGIGEGDIFVYRVSSYYQQWLEYPNDPDKNSIVPNKEDMYIRLQVLDIYDFEEEGVEKVYFRLATFKNDTEEPDLENPMDFYYVTTYECVIDPTYEGLNFISIPFLPTDLDVATFLDNTDIQDSFNVSIYIQFYLSASGVVLTTNSFQFEPTANHPEYAAAALKTLEGEGQDKIGNDETFTNSGNYSFSFTLTDNFVLKHGVTDLRTNSTMRSEMPLYDLDKGIIDIKEWELLYESRPYAPPSANSLEGLNDPPQDGVWDYFFLIAVIASIFAAGLFLSRNA